MFNCVKLTVEASGNNSYVCDTQNEITKSTFAGLHIYNYFGLHQVGSHSTGLGNCIEVAAFKYICIFFTYVEVLLRFSIRENHISEHGNLKLN